MELFSSSSEKAQLSSARLLAGERDERGAYSAGVRIELSPHAVTYWRQPGDSGAAPVFDFSASENLAGVETLYPVPKHIAEADGVVAGYDETVIFPLRVTARDARSPVKLDLRLSYAACYKICLPARAHLSLQLPAQGVSPFASELARAFERAPRKLDAAEAARQFTLTRQDDRWRVKLAGHGRIADLFADTPDWAYVSDAHNVEGGAFEFKTGTNAASSTEGDRGSLTLVTDQGAFEIPFSFK